MPYPTFLVIGAQKAGTTWLHQMLDEHPDIYVPQPKEPHFFNKRANFAKGRQWYESLFDRASGAVAVGECTPNYLWICDAPHEDIKAWESRGCPVVTFSETPSLRRDIPARVADWYPQIRLVCILRNPVDRAISSYLHQVRKGRISPRQRILDVAGSYGILGMGFYSAHLLGWFEHFPPENFLILIYEEDLAQENKQTALKRVYKHLGVNPNVIPARIDKRYNTRLGSLMLHAGYYAPTPARVLGKLVPPIKRIDWPFEIVSAEERNQLHCIYEREVERLEDMLERDLTTWKSGS